MDHDELRLFDSKEYLKFVTEWPVFMPMRIEICEKGVGEVVENAAELIW